jgi:peptide/nickel transport system permease protein
VVGYAPWGDGIWEHLRTLIIPVVSLAAGQLAVYQRLLRGDLLATLQQDFIAVAKAKGLKPRRILWRHALRPSSLTLLTVAGLQTGALIGGAIVVEVIFGIPGMGSLIQYAVTTRQYAELQSEVAVVAIVFVLVNFLVDYLYTVLDPRIRT